MKDPRDRILKEISKMDKDERMMYYVGFEITKNITTLLFKKCFDLVGLDDSVLERVRIVEAMDYIPTNEELHKRFLTFEACCIFNGLYKYGSEKGGDDPTGGEMYTILYSYFNLYNTIIKDDIWPLDGKFYEEIIEVMILHELRHIYQYENNMRGYTFCERNNPNPENYDYASDPMEIDAYGFANQIFSENKSYFSNICQKQVELYMNLLYTGVARLRNYDKYNR